MIIILFTLVFSFFLSGCGDNIDGKYSTDKGDSITFKDGKVFNDKISHSYKIQDKKIIISNPEGKDEVLAIVDKDTLQVIEPITNEPIILKKQK